jgi:hypothetical protein
MLTATGGNTVNYSAEARIRPAGVDCTAPQVAELRISIIQNQSRQLRIRNWDTPTISWNAGVPANTTVTIGSTLRRTINVPATTQDTISAADSPLYVRDANSMKPPMGCAGGAAATSNDTPGAGTTPSLTFPARSATGAVVGTVTYGHFVNVSIDLQFTTWAVVFNTRTTQICALRQRGWSINADSASGGGEQAAPDASDAEASVTPITSPPSSNDAAQNPANATVAPVGAPTTFTKPP